MKWSKSKLGLLRLCGFAFNMDRERAERPPHPALAGGSAAHAGIAELVRVVTADEPIDVRTIARRSGAGGPDELAGVLSILTLLQEELADDPPPFRGENVIHLEERLEMTVGPYTYDGHADLVEREGRVGIVTDWKTHWRPMTQEAFEADTEVPRYALLVDANHPGEFDRFVVRKRFVRYRGAVRERTIERHELEALRWGLVEEIEEAEDRVARGDFKATPGDWCTLCPHVDVCPKLQAFRANGYELAVDDDGQASELAGLVRVLDAFSQKAKRLLKAYLGNDHPTGIVPLAGGTYGFGPAHHREADAEDVLEIYREHDRPVNVRALRVDVDQLQRGLDREPGTLRRAVRSAITHFDVADCRYRRADTMEESSE